MRGPADISRWMVKAEAFGQERFTPVSANGAPAVAVYRTLEPGGAPRRSPSRCSTSSTAASVRSTSSWSLRSSGSSAFLPGWRRRADDGAGTASPASRSPCHRPRCLVAGARRPRRGRRVGSIAGDGDALRPFAAAPRRLRRVAGAPRIRRARRRAPPVPVLRSLQGEPGRAPTADPAAGRLLPAPRCPSDNGPLWPDSPCRATWSPCVATTAEPHGWPGCDERSRASSPVGRSHSASPTNRAE